MAPVGAQHLVRIAAVALQAITCQPACHAVNACNAIGYTLICLRACDVHAEGVVLMPHENPGLTSEILGVAAQLALYLLEDRSKLEAA